MSRSDEDLSKAQAQSDAAMEPVSCLVCSFDIVNEGYAAECGHEMHDECFDAFLQLPNIACDTCANAQWYFSSGQEQCRVTKEANLCYFRSRFLASRELQWNRNTFA